MRSSGNVPTWRPRKPQVRAMHIVCVVVAAFVAIALGACGGGDDSGGGDGSESVILGMETSLSGSDAAFGEANQQGAQLAVDQANEDGGVLGGRQVELQVDDDEARPEVAVGICKKFSTRAAVMLTSFSYTSIPCAEVTENVIPQITMIATSHEMTQQGNEWIFRIAVPDTGLASGVIDYALEQGYTSGAVLNQNDDFGNAGADATIAAAEEAGIDIVAHETFVVGDREFSAQLGSIADADPEFVSVWSNFAEAAAIVKQRDAFGLDEVQWIESDGAASPEYVKLGGSATTGVLYGASWSDSFDSETNQQFIADFEAEYGRRPDTFAAEGYTAALVAINAIEEAGSTDPEAVREAIAATDIDTPMGQTTFDENGDPGYSTFLVRIEGGGKESVVVGR